MNATRDNDTRTYRGRTLEEVLPKIKADLGPDAVIVRQRDGLTGGVGGFFQRQCIEVDAMPPEPARRFDAYDEDPAATPERPAQGPVEEAPSFVPDEPLDDATAEGLSSPGIQELLRQAAPFADHLSAAESRHEDAGAPRPEDRAAARHEEPPAPLPAPARERPASADAIQGALVDAGIDQQLATDVVSETVSHMLPFASPRSLKRLVRQALARRIPVAPAATGRGRTVAFVGPGGSGKTLCTARLAAAYASGSDLPVICLSLRPADGGAELAELLEPAGVAVHAVDSPDQARAHVAGAAAHALVERTELGIGIRVVEAEHRNEMFNRREALNRPAGHALRRRIGGDEIRVLGLERFELVQQAIELFVGDLGRVMDVIPLLVVPDEIAQFLRRCSGAPLMSPATAEEGRSAHPELRRA
jgi:hypothetical protein